MKVKLYTEAYYKAVAQAQAEANRTGRIHVVAETVYGVFFATTDKLPANGIGYKSTVIRPEVAA